MSSRVFFTCLFVLGLGSMGFALYLQHIEGLEPCPLCLFQRVVVIALLLWAMLGIAANPQKTVGRYLLGGLSLITALVGVGLGARHVWLQYLPADQVPECGPGLDFMMEVMPLQEVFQSVLSGSGECAEVKYRLLGLSLAEMTLIFMVMISVIATLYLLETRRKA